MKMSNFSLFTGYSFVWLQHVVRQKSIAKVLTKPFVRLIEDIIKAFIEQLIAEYGEIELSVP